ncbi:MAG: S9 family peptidase [Proteobacteria bacterium]|nr:S9 family peptidase [Pseudomonadota bacterium]
MNGSRTARLGLAAALAFGGMAHAEAAMQEDPNQWLEDIHGDKSMAWVKEHNARTEAELGGKPGFARLQSDIRAILDSEAKIPGVEKQGEWYYNFWQDKQHVRGIWRRTTLAEYRKAQPKWETIIDLDALNKAEGSNWVWHGASCLRPAYTKCLISLSPGGSDADTTREFDMTTRQFVKDGFVKPLAKGGIDWIDADHVFAQTDFGDGSMTTSGYPRIAKLWTRGTPMSAAKVVYEGKPVDMSISAGHDDTPGYERDFVTRIIDFYSSETFLRKADGTLAKIDVPDSMQRHVVRDWLVLEPRSDWSLDGKTYKAGSLLVANFNDWMAGKRAITELFVPTATTSLAGATWTKNHVVLNVLDDVKNHLQVLTPGNGEWKKSEFVGAPAIGTVAVAAVDAVDSDAVWMTASGYLTPTTLSIADVGKAPETLKTMPSFFDASKDVVEQHFVTSKDGTRVPYFIVHRKDMKFDGNNPTLLYGYGGFEISMMPGYNAVMGKAWLEPGGVYVVANIRGGGEYGPRWHEAALKQNRHKAYEDFAAVAQDLIARKITSPKRLGTMGGSNGGLLMGNMLTQYPPTFIWTTTRDDRVHPAHARKMMAKMEAAGKDVRYFENIEGGHGAGSTSEQTAKTWALNYGFLWDQLGKK